MSFQVAASEKQAFEEKGYVVLKKVLSGDQLRVLHQECRRFMDEENAEMDAQGVDNINLSFRDRRYFLPMKLKQSEAIRSIAFSPTMADVCHALLGPRVYFFLDQLVMKGAEEGMAFSWHQDSGYIPFAHRPYLTCWLPLDDVNKVNGTVYLLSYEEAGTRHRVEHVKDEVIQDKVGYFGDKPGTPAYLKAGDMAAFSSTVFHRSGPNTTKNMRRVLLLQYSAEPIYNLDGQPRHWVEPFLEEGKLVA